MGFFDSDCFESVDSKAVKPISFIYENNKQKNIKISYQLPKFSLSQYYFITENKEDRDSGVNFDIPIAEEKFVIKEIVEAAADKIIVSITSRNFNVSWTVKKSEKIISGLQVYPLWIPKWMYDNEPKLFDKDVHCTIAERDLAINDVNNKVLNLTKQLEEKTKQRSAIPSIIQMESVSVTSVHEWLKIASQQELVSVYNQMDKMINTKNKIGARATISSPGGDITVDQFGLQVKITLEDGNREFVLNNDDDLELSLYID